MSFLFRRNKSSTSGNLEPESGTDSNSESNSNSNSNLQQELRDIKKQFREKRRQEIVDKFIQRVKILFKTTIRTESMKGNYTVSRNNLIIVNRNCELLTDSDRVKISDGIKKEFPYYYVSVKVNRNSVDILIKWEAIEGKDSFWEETAACESKAIADNYNKLPYLKDDITKYSAPVESPVEIVEHIVDYLKNSTETYGSVPRQYKYSFPHIAGTEQENSNYRLTMTKVIENLPVDFHSVKGSFQRTSKNAIISYILEFIIDV